MGQCADGRSRNVELLLADARVNVNQADEDGDTPVNIAANMGRDRCLELLLADPHIRVNQTNAKGQTPMYAAAALGNVRCLELFIVSRPKIGCSWPGMKPISFY